MVPPGMLESATDANCYGRKTSKEIANRVIDCLRQSFVPGFYDVHTHSDFIVFRDPVMLSKLRQGVTTQMVGQCGQSAAPVNENMRNFSNLISGSTWLGQNLMELEDFRRMAEKKPKNFPLPSTWRPASDMEP